MSPRIYLTRLRWAAIALIAPALVLVGCGSLPPASNVTTNSSARASSLPALPPAGSGRGGYYMDDGPGDAPPEGLLDTPDAEPKIEPYATRGNKPYVVFGKQYTPFTDDRPFKQRGVGSWYGKKFHGQKTSSGEPYDMYKMTAAHPTLPIPSYVRVTNVNNGKQVIVRVNDRGPFHSGRIIDLSYTAALKLGYLGKGSSLLEVERLLPDEINRLASVRKEQLARAEQAIPTSEVLSAAAAVQSSRTEVTAVQGGGQAGEAVMTSAAASPAAAAAGTAGVGASGFYLQLGAYSQAASAESVRSRLEQTAGGILAPMEVVMQGALHRLYSGPFATRAEAAAAALRLKDRGSFKPLIVQR
ncbi:septal ring lytic transglycosylase RlpA family protein [Noviherbaspirillum agri]